MLRIHFVKAIFLFTCFLSSIFWHNAIAAQTKSHTQAQASSGSHKKSFEAEARLIAIYKLIGAGQAREAMPLAAELIKVFPNFQLGHLVYGDLLVMQTKDGVRPSDLPLLVSKSNLTIPWNELREESLQRIKGFQERPMAGTIPSQVLALASRNKHIIAVDSSKSRLYVLENSGTEVRLIMDFYISVGKEGIGKYLQGDLKTPLGIYYLSNPIDPKSLAPLYGGGALPINYPNPYDQRMGRSGSGIWLHGTMPERYSRPVKASDGCVVLANPDLQKLIATVAVRTTPVLIARQLKWVKPIQIETDKKNFEMSLARWRDAKNRKAFDQLYQLYAPDFNTYGKNFRQWWTNNRTEIESMGANVFSWKETTLLMWQPEANEKSSSVMVVTFDEINPKRKHPVTKRQYWIQMDSQWRIFFEAVIPS